MGSGPPNGLWALIVLKTERKPVARSARPSNDAEDGKITNSGQHTNDGKVLRSQDLQGSNFERPSTVDRLKPLVTMARTVRCVLSRLTIFSTTTSAPRSSISSAGPEPSSLVIGTQGSWLSWLKRMMPSTRRVVWSELGVSTAMEDGKLRIGIVRNGSQAMSPSVSHCRHWLVI